MAKIKTRRRCYIPDEEKQKMKAGEPYKGVCAKENYDPDNPKRKVDSSRVVLKVNPNNANVLNKTEEFYENEKERKILKDMVSNSFGVRVPKEEV